MTTFEIKTPAKLNLRLKVTGRRPDGYHELVSIMVPVDLFDRLEMTTLPRSEIRLACDGFEVPEDATNLVYKAAQAFFSRTGFRGGISIRLFKNIPVAAGMGGGSSDAAATLLSLNEIWERPLSISELQEMAVRLGADVPFFLYCRPSLARGIGEILEPLEKWPKYWYVIVKPPIQVSTPWVYGRLKLRLTTDEYDCIEKVIKRRSFSILEILENDLEEVTSASFPVIEAIKKDLVDGGAEGALMTGSGPTVFGLFNSLDQATAAKAYLISQTRGDVFVATNWEKGAPKTEQIRDHDGLSGI